MMDCIAPDGSIAGYRNQYQLERIEMHSEAQRKLANRLGITVSADLDFDVKIDEETLAAYTAQVEAPLQARIGQLEEALYIARHHDYQGYHKGKHWVAVADKALSESSSTWLSEYDKEVEARVIDRLHAEMKATMIASSLLD